MKRCFAVSMLIPCLMAMAADIPSKETQIAGAVLAAPAELRDGAAVLGFDAEGIAFYDFTELGDLDAFKAVYRRVLDEFGATLTETEQQRMLDEVRDAYRFNTAVFVDLGRQRAAA